MLLFVHPMGGKDGTVLESLGVSHPLPSPSSGLPESLRSLSHSFPPKVSMLCRHTALLLNLLFRSLAFRMLYLLANVYLNPCAKITFMKHIKVFQNKQLISEHRLGDTVLFSPKFVFGDGDKNTLGITGLADATS